MLTNAVSFSPVVQDVVPVMDFLRFSSLTKVMRIFHVFKFVLASRKSLDDLEMSARIYLLRLVQSSGLSKEKTFPLNPSKNEEVPLWLRV